MFYLLSFIVFSFQLSPFSFQFNKFSAFISPICISRASACALTQNRLQRYNKIPTYANLTAFFLRFVCFFVHFPFFPSFPFPIPPIPRPSPFPPSLPQYGGWPLFIYAWDVIPRPFPTPSPRALLPPIPILASLPFRLPSCRSRLSSFTPDTIRPPSLAGRVGVRLSICQVYM